MAAVLAHPLDECTQKLSQPDHELAGALHEGRLSRVRGIRPGCRQLAMAIAADDAGQPVVSLSGEVMELQAAPVVLAADHAARVSGAETAIGRLALALEFELGIHDHSFR